MSQPEANDSEWRAGERFPEMFDLNLKALGILRRHMRLRYGRTPEELFREIRSWQEVLEEVKRGPNEAVYRAVMVK